jgi:hypothetical protein
VRPRASSLIKVKKHCYFAAAFLTSFDEQCREFIKNSIIEITLKKIAAQTLSQLYKIEIFNYISNTKIWRVFHIGVFFVTFYLWMKKFTAMSISVNIQPMRTYTNGRLIILKPVIKGGEKREGTHLCFYGLTHKRAFSPYISSYYRTANWNSKI